MCPRILCVLAVLLAAGGAAWSAGTVESTAPAGEQPLASKLVSVGLFKNGLAVLRREATLPQAGTFVLARVPDPIHGTFWVESSAELETQVQARDEPVPMTEAGPVDLEADLQGRNVTIHFHNEKQPAVQGKIIQRRRTSTGIEGVEPNGAEPPGLQPLPRPHDDFLILETDASLIYVRASQIARIETSRATQVLRKRPVLLLKAGPNAPYPLKVSITYLARGLSWAPSYRVDITDPKTLKLEQATVIRNELTDLKDVEVQLISGFPSVQFGHVRSPLAANTTWSRFFTELGQDPNWRGRGHAMMAQQVASNAFFAQEGVPSTALPNVPGSDGIDLHYQSIGPRTLTAGSSLALPVARASADYERIVEWLVPDTRNEYGQQQRREGTDDDDPWDALRFRNPFAFPMTSAPAFVVAAGKFGGQRLSTYVSPGEETVLRVNKALSIRARAVETEAQNGSRPGMSDRDVIWIGGQRYRQATVDGELQLTNNRKEEVKLKLRRRFSGELLKADANPKVVLREEGVWSVNRRNEMQWELTLKPGEERKLTYRYHVLVSF